MPNEMGKLANSRGGKAEAGLGLFDPVCTGILGAAGVFCHPGRLSGPWRTREPPTRIPPAEHTARSAVPLICCTISPTPCRVRAHGGLF